MIRVLLTRPILRELRLVLLGYASPSSVELELVEERYSNGDVVVRLARPDRPGDGERVLGAYNVTPAAGTPLFPDPNPEGGID